MVKTVVDVARLSCWNKNGDHFFMFLYSGRLPLAFAKKDAAFVREMLMRRGVKVSKTVIFQ